MFTDDAERALQSFSPIRPSFLLCGANSRRLRIFLRDLIRSLPVRSTFGLPVYVAASPAASFSTSLRMRDYPLDRFVLEVAFALQRLRVFVLSQNIFVVLPASSKKIFEPRRNT